MFDKFTYQKKCLTIGIGFILCLVIIYKLSISKTIETEGNINEKEEKLAWLKAKEKEIPLLKKNISLINKICREDSVSIRDRLTSFISDYAESNNCTVTEIPHAIKYKSNNIAVETNLFTIKGNFKDLIQLENLLEKEFNVIAKVLSARLFCIQETQSKKKNLYLSVITQSFNQLISKTNSK
jgi:hypothetical protein